MISYTKAAMERAMKVQEVILRALAKRITWWHAAESYWNQFRNSLPVEAAFALQQGLPRKSFDFDPAPPAPQRTTFSLCGWVAP